MAQLSEHPSVIRFRERADAATAAPPPILDAGELRRICLEAGADDVGFVQVERPALADQRADILQFFPHTQSLISFVRRMNREPIHNPARSVANVEFHQIGDRVNETAHHIVAARTQKVFARLIRRWDFRWRWVGALVIRGIGRALTEYCPVLHSSVPDYFFLHPVTSAGFRSSPL